MHTTATAGNALTHNPSTLCIELAHGGNPFIGSAEGQGITLHLMPNTIATLHAVFTYTRKGPG